MTPGCTRDLGRVHPEHQQEHQRHQVFMFQTLIHNKLEYFEGEQNNFLIGKSHKYLFTFLKLL
jgi:hypothetical protein